MITLQELHNPSTLLRNPYDRQALEIIAGRRPGKVHAKSILKRLQANSLVDSRGKITLIGLHVLDIV